MGDRQSTIEMQVSLGLQDARQQVQQLHKLLEQSVKVDSSSFSNINKVLKQAQDMADKLAGKMGDAFKTSSSSTRFLNEYQKMLETLATAKSKMGNIGFEDIKFSVKDQDTVDQAVQKIQELSKTVENIKAGKAIELINSSTVDGIDNLREQVGKLVSDTSKLTFEGLNSTLKTATESAREDIQKINNDIKSLESTITNINTSGLADVKAAVNSTMRADGQGSISRSLVNVSDIDQANERLRQLANTLSDIPTKLKSFTVGRDENVAKFISEQTDKIEREYARQIQILQNDKEKVNSILINMNTAARGAQGRFRSLNDTEKTDILNSADMQAAIQILNLDLKKIFEGIDENDVSAKFKVIKAALTAGLQSLNVKENNLIDLKSSIGNQLSEVFDGLGEEVVAKQTDVQNKIKETLKSFNIDASALKDFGFDISSIRNGQELVSVYNSLKSALNGYVQSLQNQKDALSNTDLKNAEAALRSLEGATETAGKVQQDSASQIDALNKKIEEQWKIINDLREAIEGVNGKPLNIGNGNIEKSKNAIEGYIKSLTSLEGKQKALSNVQSAVSRWMGFYQVLNLTKRAIKDMISHITELDTVMTQIAVVTNMSQDDLWGQIGNYSEIARQYGVAIKGVYEVSQIYYQQGLNKGDVMNLTTETLKMARIAGIDYATAADYMTTAIRGFKMEMSEANRVTDVFSNLAAHTASDTEELATAISKTASSAEAVGASFEATSAMIATMVSVTRESATNIGTALKSVISRYGEMTSDPTKLVDSEGEEMSLNRVDKALRSIGITIQDTNGQFRDFDDVILELGEKWNSLDKNAQRYIATIMAGNRQQSRFLALVGNVEEYKRALELANNSEDTGELQTLKTLDSIDAKMERMKVTIQEFYTSSGIQDLYKGILDTITNVISAANNLPKAFGNIPAMALTIGMQLINIIKNIANLAIASLSQAINSFKSGSILSVFDSFKAEAGNAGEEAGNNFMTRMSNVMTGLSSGVGKRVGLYISSALAAAGAWASVESLKQYGSSDNSNQDRQAGMTMVGSAFAQAGSSALTAAIVTPGGPIAKGIAAVASGLISFVPSIQAAFSMMNVTLAREIELAEKRLTSSQQEATIAKGEQNDLEQAYSKLKQLSEAQYSSVEAMQEYHEYMNQLADSYPSLVSAMEINGDQIITLTSLEEALAAARRSAADASLDAVLKEKDLLLQQKLAASELATNMDKKVFDYDIASSFSTVSEIEKALDDIGYKRLFTDVSQSDFDYKMENDYERIVKAYNAAIKEGKYTGGTEIELEGNDINYIEVYEDNINSINDFINAFLFNSIEAIAQYKEVLKKAVENNKNYSYEFLTGIKGLNKDNLDSTLDNLSGEEVIKALQRTRDLAQQGLDKVAHSLTVIGDTLSFTSANAVVNEQLELNNKTKSGINLNPYSTFLTSMMGRYGTNIDWKDQGTLTSDVYNGLVNYIDQYQADADYLMNNLVFSQIQSIQELQKILKEHNFTTDNGINSNIIQSIINDYKTSMAQIRSVYYDSIKAYVTKNPFTSNVGRELWHLFDQRQTDDNLIAELIPTLQSALPEYQELMNQGYTVAAENYLSGLITLYQSIGKLDPNQQEKLLPTLQSLDLTDTSSIDQAMVSFENMGLTDLVNILTNVRNSISTNIGLSISSMVDEAYKTVESAEKALGNIGKGMDYSAALKEAQTIIAKSQNKDRTADSLIEWNDTLNKYTLTIDALEESYNQVTESYKAQIDAISRQAEIIEDSAIQGAIKNAGMINASGEQITAVFSETRYGLTDTEANLLSQTVQNLKEQYKSYKDENGEKAQSWSEWVIPKLKEFDDNQLEFLQTYLDKSPLQLIAQTDWTKFARGTATEDEQKWLSFLLGLIGATEEQINTILAQIREGEFTALENITHLSFSKETKKSAITANVEQYVTFLNELTDPSINGLSDASKELAKSFGRVGVFAKNLKGYPAIVQELIEKSYTALKEMYENNQISLETYNNAIASAVKSTTKMGQTKDVLDAVKDGLSLDELKSLATTYGYKITDLINEETGEFTNSIQGQALSNIFDLDKITGTYKLKDLSPDYILEQLGIAYGITLEKGSVEYQKWYSEVIQAQITEADNTSVEKNMAKQLETLSSAKVGQTVDISYIPEEVRSALNLGDSVEITSVTARNILVKSLITAIGDTSDATLKATLSSLNESLIVNKSEGLNGIISSDVGLSAAKTFAASLGASTDLETVREIMEGRGYIYNEYTQSFKAGNDSLKYLRGKLQLAKAGKDGATQADVNKLEAQIAQLTYDLDQGQIQKDLLAVLQNYSSVSYDVFEALETSTGLELDEAISSDTNGAYQIDVQVLKTLLEKAGIKFNDAVLEQFSNITDQYTSSIQNAVSLVTQGTTSDATMQQFATAWKEAGLEEKSVAELFKYDDILDAWTLKPEYLKEFAEAQAKRLGLTDTNDINEYVKSLTSEILAQTIDIDSFLSAENKDINGQAYKKLHKQLKDYFTSIGQVLSDEKISDIITALSKGGPDAVGIARNLAEAAGRELSAEEIQKYYAPLAEKYSSMASKLAELTVGQYIAEGEMRDILAEAGVVDKTTGLVTSVKNMAKAYKDIYDKMKGAAGRTQKQLNSIYASYLTSSKKSEIDAISTLNDAMGMTYEALGDLLGDYGKSLETFTNNLGLYGLEDIGGGQVRINDFRAFASSVGLTDSTSEAYISAFKAYNDSLIALDNSTRNAITEEIQAIASANPGERINLTTYWTSLDKAVQSSINTSLLEYGGLITDGILRISEQADIKGIIDAILSQNDLKGNLLPDQVAALYDTLDATFTGMIDSVRSAAEGTISGEEYAKLHNWAQQSYNIDIGQGVKTAEGYQMNEDALFALYDSVSKVDAMLAKSMIPDLSKVSSQYKTLPDLLKAYADATGEAKRSLLKAAISSQLRNPDNYNIMGGELPTTWQIAENFYGGAKQAQTVTNQMINKGQVSVSDFSSLMQLIMSGNNAADRQQALEWMQSAPEFFVETSDGLMVNTAKMGIKNLKELNRMWIEAAQVLQQNGAEEQKVYNLLYYGSESLQNADIRDEKGNISAQKIKKIADAKTKQGENVKNLLDNIKINNQSLYNYLDDKNLDEKFTQEMRDKLLTTLADTNWDFENFDDDTLKMFKDAGLKGTVKIDGEKGQITFEYNQDATTVEKEYTYGGTKFKDINEYLEFLALTDKDGFTKTTSGTGENKTVTGGIYRVNDEVEVIIDIRSGSVSYSFEYGGKTFTATNEASIRQAIADWVPKPEGGEIEGTQETISYTVNVGEAKVEVKYDQKGDRKLLFDPNESTDLADEVRAKTSETIEIPTPVTAVATIKDLKARLDENAQVYITKNADGDIKATWAEAEGTVKSITLTPEAITVNGLQDKIQQLLNDTGSILTITPDTSAVDAWYNSFDPRKVIKIEPRIVGNDSLHFDISYSNSEAKGNVALASGTRSTLMGELGPELWVSGGHYYVAGQNGAEFVDLPNDAIVFNHLQTANLLNRGFSGRGKPITNATNATAMASGNIYEQIRNAKATRDNILKGGSATDNSALDSINRYIAQLEKEAAARANNAAKAQEEAAEALEDAANAQQKAADATAEAAETSNVASKASELVHSGEAKTYYTSTATAASTNGGNTNRKTSLTWDNTYGQGNTLGLNLSGMSAGTGTGTSGNSSSSSSVSLGNLSSEEKTAVQNIVSDVLSKGFASIDVSSYEKLPSSIASEIEDKIANNTSYRDFLVAYAEALDKSTSEINELYFEAWQKDLENYGSSEDMLNAAEGLTFYGSGIIAGSASDWTTLFGDYTTVQELVENKIIEWDATLKQYVVKNAEELSKYGTDLTKIDNYEAVLNDSHQAIVDSITELLGSVDGLTAAQLEELKTKINLEGFSIDWSSAKLINGKYYLTPEIQSQLQQALEDAQQGIGTVSVEIAQQCLDAFQDGIITQFGNITDSISKGLEGTLTNVDISSLKVYLESLGISDLDLSFERTKNGFAMAQESAIALYYRLKEIDSLQAELVFDELNESLSESNDHYKTTTSLLEHIQDLTEKIADTDKYSDEKIKQYEQELSLAKEIAQVRATTEDESMNWLDADIPGAFNNPINYISDWMEAWKTIGEAGSTGVIGFQQMYNIITEVNKQAGVAGEAFNFLGHTLDGTKEAFNEAVNAAIGALGSENNNYGVVLSKFGIDMEAGAESYADSVDSTIKTMAQAQIKVLDGLIQMFEVIVAMEQFEGLDIDKDNWLDWKELFNTDDLTEAATEFQGFFKEDFVNIAESILANSVNNVDLANALDNIKVNGNTMREMFQYATGAINDLTNEMTAGDYALAMSVFYNAAMTGDYDLDNVAKTLKEKLLASGSNFKGTIEYGDFILDMRYGVKITKTEKGTYTTPSGKEYTSYEEAAAAAALEEIGVNKDGISFTAEGSATGTLQYKEFEIVVTADSEGNITYSYKGASYDTLEEAQDAAYNDLVPDQSISKEQWQIKQGITLTCSVTDVDTSDITQDKIQKLVGVSLDEYKANDQLQAEVGITLESGTSEEDWAAMKERLGIKNEMLELTLEITNLSEILTEIVTSLGQAFTINLSGTAESGEMVGTPTTINQQVSIDITEAQTALATLEESIGKVNEAITGLNEQKAETDTSLAQTNLSKLKDLIDTTSDSVYYLNSRLDALSYKTINISATGLDDLRTIADRLDAIKEDIESLKKEEINGIITLNINTEGGSDAKGTVIGNAFAGGSRQVLMGELGPELYVSNGRYHIAGSTGAEFVNLPNDAIVFNHLQTRKLLSTGSAGRGKPITNERDAVSFARGNSGEAMATAQETLDFLKQLRAMWESIANSSISDLVTIAETGNTDSSGGNKIDPKRWLETVERWYNWLQKIAELEAEINYQEQLRNKINSDRDRDGVAYYASVKASLAQLQEQIATEKDLVHSQQEYFNERLNAINNDQTPLRKFYDFDENGQLRWQSNVNGTGQSGFEVLEDLWSVLTPSGRAKYTPKEQYDKAVALGLEQFMQFDASGVEIVRGEEESDDDFYIRKLQALMDKVDGERDEMQSLHDSINNYNKEILSLEQKRNELLQALRDNQLALEDQLLEAIENREQAIIDQLQDTRDALNDSATRYIDGLNDALSNERNMYNQQAAAQELESLRRQLSILERSGGSSSAIAALQKQISSKEQENYFAEQQSQIDAIKAASDLEIERLDMQIELMTEELEYAKAHGLLWVEVNQIMQKDGTEIVQFLKENTKDFQSLSILGQEKSLEEMSFLVEQWTAYRDDENKFGLLQDPNAPPINVNLQGIAGQDLGNSSNNNNNSKSNGMGTSNENNIPTSKGNSSSYQGGGSGADLRSSGSINGGNSNNTWGLYSNYPSSNLLGASGSNGSSDGQQFSSWEAQIAHDFAIWLTQQGEALEVQARFESQQGIPLAADVAAMAQREFDRAGNGRKVNLTGTNYVFPTETQNQRDFANWRLTGYALDALHHELDPNYSVGDGRYAGYNEVLRQNNMSELTGADYANWVQHTSSSLFAQKGFAQLEQEFNAWLADPEHNPRPSFKKGGSVDFTGPAIVHGTPSHPEYFLDAEETQMWRHDILGNNNSSLTSLLLRVRENLAETQSLYNNFNSVDNGMNIENVEVHLHIDSLADSYDARNAAQDVLDELMQISRKAGANGVRR